ncbi:MAG: squalene/phytoene synthase family protein, partial [Gammaproteobacteria bacterium]|nr:squalene/phytoene synthase family protein [Gammaproteobacteria bacterium]
MSEQIANPGSDLYYSWLFLDKPKKVAIKVLYEFCNTLERLLTLKENDIFMVKWAWWQQEIVHLVEHKATHPAAIALQDIIVAYKIPATLLQDYLDGIKQTRELDHCCTEEDFNAFSYRSRGIVQTLSAYIYGFRDLQVLHYTRAIAVPLSLMDEIVYIGRNLRKDRVFLPLNTLASWQEA